jgi:hypothetical protein
MWVLLIVVLLLPILLFLGPRFAQIALANGKRRLAYSLVLIPQGILYLPLLLSILLMFGTLLYYAF